MPLGIAVMLGFALGMSLIAAEGLRRILLRLRWVDAPRQDRWHDRPVPRPGGPAIFLTIVVGVFLFIDRPWGREVWALLVGSGFVFTMGLADDVFKLPNPLKLTLLILSALIPPIFGITFGTLSPAIAVPLSILWILIITNALNWLDNMDGLAAGTAAIAAGALLMVSLDSGGGFVGKVAVLIGGACLGFLVLNFPPAKIFMGDSGSGTLGFVLAYLAIVGGHGHIRDVLLTLIVPAMILSVPIFDSALVSLTRLVNGRRIFQGGRDHPSHRLVVLGLSERRAVVSLYALSAVGGAAAVVSVNLGAWSGLVLAGVVFAGFIALGLALARVRVYEGVPSPGEVVGVVVYELARKRRIPAILIDLVLICAAYVGAALLRFEGAIPAYFQQIIGQSIPIVLGMKLALLYGLGVYRNDWRYAGWLDLVTLAKALTLGSLGSVAALFMWTRLADFSRAVFIIDWILAFLLLGGLRVSTPLLQEYFAAQRAGGKRALIVGGGPEGILLLGELRNNPALAYHPVGFIDDDPAKRGTTLRGLRVLGGRDDIPILVPAHQVEEVLVAVPSLGQDEAQRILRCCQEAGVPCRFTGHFFDPAYEFRQEPSRGSREE